MRNDVTIPPDEPQLADTPVISEPPEKEISTEPVPPPEGLKADVSLFDHPDLEPGGAGNFWLLAIIGFILVGVVIVVFWVLHGLMK